MRLGITKKNEKDIQGRFNKVRYPLRLFWVFALVLLFLMVFLITGGYVVSPEALVVVSKGDPNKLIKLQGIVVSSNENGTFIITTSGGKLTIQDIGTEVGLSFSTGLRAKGQVIWIGNPAEEGSRSIGELVVIRTNITAVKHLSLLMDKDFEKLEGTRADLWGLDANTVKPWGERFGEIVRVSKDNFNFEVEPRLKGGRIGGLPVTVRKGMSTFLAGITFDPQPSEVSGGKNKIVITTAAFRKALEKARK